MTPLPTKNLHLATLSDEAFSYHQCPSFQGSLRFLRTIEGFTSFSRFGYAMANLGDISGDGGDGKCEQRGHQQHHL